MVVWLYRRFGPVLEMVCGMVFVYREAIVEERLSIKWEKLRRLRTCKTSPAKID